MSPDDDDKLLKPGEAAQMLNMSPITLAQWTREGKLPAEFTSGGHRRYRLNHIRALQVLFSQLEAEHSQGTQMEQDAVRLYAEGMTIRQVAARFETSYGAMRHIIRTHSTLRPRGGRPDDSRWRDVARRLTEAIYDGKYKEGAQLPTSSLLAEEMGVTRWAVICATRHLAEEGRLSVQTGSGTFVNPVDDWPVRTGR